MSTNTEISRELKDRLYDLLTLKRSGIESPVLDHMINKAMAVMTQEDVAWVEKQISKLD
jgi:hypothetical protein